MTKREKIIGLAVALVVIAVIAVIIAKIPKAEKKPEKTTEPVSTSQTVTSTTETTTEKPTETEVTTADIPDVEYNIQNSIIIQGTRAMEMYGISESALESYADIISTLAERCPKVKVYSLIAPTQVEFYGPEDYRTGNRSQRKGIQIAYDFMSDKVIKVDAWSSLAQHTDEYLYYRTDHHWTARGAYYAYLAFAKAAGIENPQPLDKYETGKEDGFVGTMYGFSGKAQVLADNPDYIEYFMPLNNAKGEILGVGGDGSLTGNNQSLMIVNPNAGNYAGTFIQGDQALEKIVTDKKNGRKILLIKESYGNCFAPFLTEAFEEIYILDPRKDGVNQMSLPSFIEENGITDVIALNYALATSNPTIKNSFSKIVNQ
ncbi:MAG: hypothetical protein E7515_03185 [Ruminococcaceae bacterium]|jgi:hypothetical protein|nr:hypothetical protein [Oscillospiraceae bacterium]